MIIDTGQFQAIQAGVARVRRAADQAWDNGRDGMAHEMGTLIVEMRDAGKDAEAILGAMMDLIAARMEVSLPEAEWFG